jgi:hypothetical protein
MPFDADYIREKSIPIPFAGCWIWMGQIDKDGYGQFRMCATDKWHKAHRASYELFVGEIPAGKNVLHTCDVPGCVNPAHLYIGTQKDNVRDMQERGRANYVGNPKSKCKRGHELSAGNRLGKRGQDCKICHRMRQEKYRRNVDYAV